MHSTEFLALARRADEYGYSVVAFIEDTPSTRNHPRKIGKLILTDPDRHDFDKPYFTGYFVVRQYTESPDGYEADIWSLIAWEDHRSALEYLETYSRQYRKDTAPTTV